MSRRPRTPSSSRTTTNAANSTFDNTTDIAAATTYLLVGKISGSTTNFDRVDIFVNPGTLAEPSPSATFTLDSGISTLAQLIIRTASLDAGDAYVMDELRMGLDYAAVIPEPSCAVLLCAAAMVITRRKP